MHKITSNYHVLFNDGENDVIYSGTNKFGNIILGVIIFDDDDNNYLRYLHVILDDYQHLNFFTKKITLREILETNGSFFIIDKKYNKEEIRHNLISFDELPDEFKPSEKSYCPDILYKPSLEYSFSLQGGLSDYHLATPEELGVIIHMDKFLKTPTDFVNVFELGRNIYVEAGESTQLGMTGSFKIKFKIELQQSLQLSILPTPSLDNIASFFNKYFGYIFQKLPEESDTVFKHEIVASDDFHEIETILTAIYTEGQIDIPTAGLEQQLIDNISKSIQNLKEIDYSQKGFNRISFINYSKTGQEVPIGIIDKDFVPKLERKFFKPETQCLEDVIETDLLPKEYKIQVYLFNIETGNGSAHLEINDGIVNISLHVVGKRNYSNTKFTHSMDKKKFFKVSGFAKRVNGEVKQLRVELF